MNTWVEWLLSGGLVTLFGIASKLFYDLRRIKVQAAKAAAETARFEADVAGSSTRVVGEGILKGLMVTLVQREQEAHELTALVMAQLTEARNANADLRESNAALVEKEETLLHNNSLLLTQIETLGVTHKGVADTLRRTIYTLTKRLEARGEAFSATDVAGEGKLII